MWHVDRKHRLGFLVLADFVAPLIPCGLAAGRLGNFINGELYGRVADVPWAMLFQSPGAGPLPRHPSQLYQFALEGLLLFALLWFFSAKARPKGAIAAAFLLGYGVFRFIAEYFRAPGANTPGGRGGSASLRLLEVALMTISNVLPANRT